MNVIVIFFPPPPSPLPSTKQSPFHHLMGELSAEIPKWWQHKREQSNSPKTQGSSRQLLLFCWVGISSFRADTWHCNTALRHRQISAAQQQWMKYLKEKTERRIRKDNTHYSKGLVCRPMNEPLHVSAHIPSFNHKQTPLHSQIIPNNPDIVFTRVSFSIPIPTPTIVRPVRSQAKNVRSLAKWSRIVGESYSAGSSFRSISYAYEKKTARREGAGGVETVVDAGWGLSLIFESLNTKHGEEWGRKLSTLKKGSKKGECKAKEGMQFFGKSYDRGAEGGKRRERDGLWWCWKHLIVKPIRKGSLVITYGCVVDLFNVIR